MAYNERAKEMRRCKATRKDGQPCQAWALWGGEFCSGHTYKTRKPTSGPPYTYMHSKAPACHCAAYAWPHRPGGGLCNWPDPPEWRCTTPAGTHGGLRYYRQAYRQRWGKDSKS